MTAQYRAWPVRLSDSTARKRSGAAGDRSAVSSECYLNSRRGVTVRRAATALIAWVGLTPYPVWGQDPAAQSLAANCTGCHGPNGVSAGAIPTIAGLEKAYLVTAMQEFKAGTRQATVMHQHAKGYTDQEIEQLAAYFSQQKRP